MLYDLNRKLYQNLNQTKNQVYHKALDQKEKNHLNQKLLIIEEHLFFFYLFQCLKVEEICEKNY